MPTRQNKAVRFYGPWRGQDDSGSRTRTVDFERSYNIEIEGEEIVTRNGRVPFFTGGTDRVTAIGRVRGNLYAARKADSTTAPTLARLTGDSTWTPIALPASVNARDVWSRFSFWDEAIVLTGGFGPPLVFDVDGCYEIVGAYGRDHADLGTGYVVGALDAAVFSAKYHGQMYMVTRSGTVYFSENEANVNNIPIDGTAPFGALNVWPANNNFDARASATDEARGCIVFGDQLVLPTRDALFTWDGYQVRRVPGAPGCIAPDSLAVTPAGLAYLAADGVYLFDGSKANRISDPVQTALRSYVRFAYSGAVGVHYPRRAQYRLYVPSSGSTENRFCLVWDYRENRWWTHGGTPPWLAPSPAYEDMAVSCVAVEYPGKESELLVTGDYSGRVWAEDVGRTDNGKRIWSGIVFMRIGLSEDAGIRIWRDVTVEARATGAALNVSLLTEGEDFTAGGVPAVTLTTLMQHQSSWLVNNAYPVQRTTDGAAKGGPMRVWRHWRFPWGIKSRTAQPVIYSTGNGRLAVRGIEVMFRLRGGRTRESV